MRWYPGNRNRRRLRLRRRRRNLLTCIRTRFLPRSVLTCTLPSPGTLRLRQHHRHLPPRRLLHRGRALPLSPGAVTPRGRTPHSFSHHFWRNLARRRLQFLSPTQLRADSPAQVPHGGRAAKVHPRDPRRNSKEIGVGVVVQVQHVDEEYLRHRTRHAGQHRHGQTLLRVVKNRPLPERPRRQYRIDGVRGHIRERWVDRGGQYSRGCVLHREQSDAGVDDAPLGFPPEPRLPGALLEEPRQRRVTFDEAILLRARLQPEHVTQRVPNTDNDPGPSKEQWDPQRRLQHARLSHKGGAQDVVQSLGDHRVHPVEPLHHRCGWNPVRSP
mmetsp:Transcript_3049/g.12043  ORF Transcript_3049/g.12043 Transcript_3049/m.12043 type:complete len:327 (+) Transcript_3049:1484-2464(+)